jgi:hypothetical protein
LLIRKEQLGLLESLVLEVLERRFRRNVTYRETSRAINQSIATDMSYMNAQKERGSDSENFGTRITGFERSKRYDFLKFWSYFCGFFRG